MSLFRKIRCALFSCYHRFEIPPFTVLPKLDPFVSVVVKPELLVKAYKNFYKAITKNVKDHSSLTFLLLLDQDIAYVSALFLLKMSHEISMGKRPFLNLIQNYCSSHRQKNQLYQTDTYYTTLKNIFSCTFVFTKRLLFKNLVFEGSKRFKP